MNSLNRGLSNFTAFQPTRGFLSSGHHTLAVVKSWLGTGTELLLIRLIGVVDGWLRLKAYKSQTNLFDDSGEWGRGRPATTHSTHPNTMMAPVLRDSKLHNKMVGSASSSAFVLHHRLVRFWMLMGTNKLTKRMTTATTTTMANSLLICH